MAGVPGIIVIVIVAIPSQSGIWIRFQEISSFLNRVLASGMTANITTNKLIPPYVNIKLTINIATKTL